MSAGFQEVEFDFVADNPGPTLFHCHQQLHMDFGFMAMFNNACRYNSIRVKARHRLGADLDDAHHPLVLMVDGVTVIDEPTDNHRIGKRDHYLQRARALIRRGRH